MHAGAAPVRGCLVHRSGWQICPHNMWKSGRHMYIADNDRRLSKALLMATRLTGQQTACMRRYKEQQGRQRTRVGVAMEQPVLRKPSTRRVSKRAQRPGLQAAIENGNTQTISAFPISTDHFAWSRYTQPACPCCASLILCSLHVLINHTWTHVATQNATVLAQPAPHASCKPAALRKSGNSLCEAAAAAAAAQFCQSHEQAWTRSAPPAAGAARTRRRSR